MNPLPAARLDRMEQRADYVLDSEDDGRSSIISAADVKDLIEEVRRLRARYEPGPGRAGDDRAS
jgi:hypothetical protein